MAESSNKILNNNAPDDNNDGTPKWRLAKETLDKFLNNQENEAMEVFQKHSENVHMYAGYFIAKVIDALMTLEEDKLTAALVMLKETEKKCRTDNYSWFISFKAKTTTTNLADQLETQIILADSYMLAAALTFMQQDLSGYFKGGWILRKAWKQYHEVYGEILKLYNAIDKNRAGVQGEDLGIEQDVAPNESDNVPEKVDNGKPKIEQNGYLDSSSSASSASYAHYTLNNTFLPKDSKSCYENLESLLKEKKVDGNDSAGEDSKSTTTTNTACSSRPESPNYPSFMRKSSSVNSALSKHLDRTTRRISNRLSTFGSNLSLSYFTSTFNLFTTTNANKVVNIDNETVIRLMGAVSFGYGLLQLGISLLPPALVKITNILGFQGNRQAGINNLMLARLSQDMRAPLATLSLLWYHTIVRPFYALDGNNVQAGVEVASELIAESSAAYENSALFLFFKGRVLRLSSKIDNALSAFRTAVDNSNQREIRLLALHEIGWCQMVQLSFKEASMSFHTLRSTSRWSRSFYTYVTAICSGAASEEAVDAIIAEFNELIKCIPKGTQLDVFLTRRLNIFVTDDFNVKQRGSDLFYKMLIYELLYLWNTLPSCSSTNIDRIIDDCQRAVDGGYCPMPGLSKLIQASAYCIKNDLRKSVELLREIVEERKNLAYNSSDAHISAFACYELGLLLLKDPELKSEGVQSLENTLSYKNYDFEQRLEVRVASLIRRHQ